MQDFTVIFGLTALYFFAILLFVVYARYKTTKSLLPDLNEFFLAGKSLTPLVLTFTFLGSLLSTFSVLGMPGLVYAHGIGAIYFIVIADALGLFLIMYLGKKMRRMADGERMFSPVEVISQSYASRKLGFLVAAVFVLLLIPYISLQLVGVGSFIESYTDGAINYLTGVGSMMVIVALYLIVGGMRAVAYTDVIQFLAIMVGLVFCLIYVLCHYDITILGVLSDVKSAKPDYFSLPGPKGFFTIPMLLSFSFVVIGIFIQPHLMTRAMMARSDKEINYIYGGMIGGFIVMRFVALVFGLLAFHLYGADLKPNFVMGRMFQDIGGLSAIGGVIAALMLMGVLGAAMSTADSLLISIGQVTTRDMVRPFFKMTSKRQVMLSKFIMMLVLGFSFLMGLNPPKYMTDLAVYSGAGCSVLLPTFLCLSWRYRSTRAAVISIAGGITLLAYTVYVKLTDGNDLFGVHAGTLPMVFAFASYFIICLLMKKEAQAETN